MAQVVKHVPKLGYDSQQEAMDGVARAHHPAWHGACPEVGPVLTSPIQGGGGGHVPLGAVLGGQQPWPEVFAVGHAWPGACWRFFWVTTLLQSLMACPLARMHASWD